MASARENIAALAECHDAGATAWLELISRCEALVRHFEFDSFGVHEWRMELWTEDVHFHRCRVEEALRNIRVVQA